MLLRPLKSYKNTCEMPNIFIDFNVIFSKVDVKEYPACLH